LRREKVGYGSGLNDGDRNNEKKKTLKEREEEYRKARERIFGASTPTTDAVKGKESGKGNSNGKGQQQQQQQQRKANAPKVKS
jgi:hypothetical protein